MAEFVEAEGLVHVTNPTLAEFTLCGDAFDLSSDVAGYAWTATKRRTVTCPSCVEIIRYVRPVRTSLQQGGAEQ